MDQASVEISVVAPCYNEGDLIRDFCILVKDVMDNLIRHYEIIIVDDGSTDDTLDVLKELKGQMENLRVISFATNCGQSAAFDAGFKQAKGVIIVTLDSDLQNDPRDIPTLLEHLGEYDLVTGWRKNRKDNFIRRISSKIANWVRNKLSGEDIHDSACSLRAFKRECVEKLKLYNGLHRFIPTLVKMEGYKVLEIPVSHLPRLKGKGKYGVFNRVFKAFRALFVVRWMKKNFMRYDEREI